ncbi:response regulator transcription factor [Xanthocytophaga agilis]|uniref:Response regulator transcription factor n=1 Tax=Xanthocytophaga agilis TaxID=3048010 RepID=A0AAE3R8R9_9BACT|nr:response regulator transcription factor [Xanthocytophaga agilis]MDJ1505814.1 response regulator transcription factor [Xanthocytophaga agilis]
MEKPIRVSIVEDIVEVREGLRFLLHQTGEFVCVATYESAETALAGMEDNLPDLLIMDISLPAMNGLDCIRSIKNFYPSVECIVFTIYEDSEQVFEALQAGASGYLLKKTQPHKIIDALKELAAGGSPMSASIARKVVTAFQEKAIQTEEYHLSEREKQILDGLSKGLFYKEIAHQLSIGSGTVRQHIHRIYKKLHVQNRTEAINKVFGR